MKVVNYPFNPPIVEHSILQVEASLYNLDTEIGYLFDEDGNVVLRKEGTEKELQFTPAELAQGVILTHYHTDNDSFTQDDILVGIDHHYIEVRAVTDTHLYVVRFPEHYQGRKIDRLLTSSADESSVPTASLAVRPRHELWDKGHFGFFYFCGERDSINIPKW